MIGDIKKFRNRFKNNKEGKTVIANFGYLSLLQIAGYIFPLITIPYLSKVIGTTGFGKIAYAAAIMVWIQTIVDWGFNYTATRDVAKNRDNKILVSEIFSNVLWARLFLSILAALVLGALILFIPSFRAEADVIMVTFLLVPGHLLFPDWFFQAVEKMKYTTMFNLCIKLLFTIAVFVFVKDPSDYILQPLFTSLGYIVCGIISMWIIIRKWGIKVQYPNYKAVYLTISSSTDVFINSIVHNLYYSTSVIILGFFGGNVANGIFDAGNKFIGIATSFLNVTSRAFFPFLSRHLDKHTTFTYINMGASLMASILLFVIAPWLIDVFFTKEFSDAVIVLRILSLSIFFVNMYYTFGINYLIVANKERLLRNLTIICSVVGLLISIPLIYSLGFVGAALTISIVRVLLGFTAFYFARKEKKSCNH